jgi:hypothetical protein
MTLISTFLKKVSTQTKNLMKTIVSCEFLKPGQLRKEKIPYNFHISD